MTKIVLTKWVGGNAYQKKGGRLYLDKERILEVHESDSKAYCTLVLKGSKDGDYYHVCESFDEVKALIEFEPEVADIVLKGKELS